MNRLAIITTIAIISLTIALTGCDNLSVATYHGKYDRVQELIKKGQDVNAYDDYGWTPLMWAAYYNYYTIARLLLENGANPNAISKNKYSSFNKGTTPLMVAAYYGHTLIIKEMLKYRGNPRIEDPEGNSAITYAEQYHGESVSKVFDMQF